MTRGAETVLSAVLGLANITGTVLVSRGRRWAWWGILALQLAWVPYDLATGQAGLLVISAAAVPAAVHGLTGHPLISRGWARAGQRLSHTAVHRAAVLRRRIF